VPAPELRPMLLALAARTRFRTQLAGFGGTESTSPRLRVARGAVRASLVAHHNPRVGGSSPSSGMASAERNAPHPKV
jgi:hypothetical protein